MSDKICIFAGTTEGRRLASFLAGAADVTACVATEYGQIMLDGIDGIAIHSGRMDEGEMKTFFKTHSFSLIIFCCHTSSDICSTCKKRCQSSPLRCSCKNTNLI